MGKWPDDPSSTTTTDGHRGRGSSIHGEIRSLLVEVSIVLFVRLTASGRPCWQQELSYARAYILREDLCCWLIYIVMSSDTKCWQICYCSRKSSAVPRSTHRLFYASVTYSFDSWNSEVSNPTSVELPISGLKLWTNTRYHLEKPSFAFMNSL